MKLTTSSAHWQKQAEREGVLTFLVTPDKDFMQLVSDTTKIFKPGKFGTDVEIVDRDGVNQKFGVSPDKVIDVLDLSAMHPIMYRVCRESVKRQQFLLSRNTAVSKKSISTLMIFRRKVFALNWKRTKNWHFFPSSSSLLISMYRFLSIFIL